MLRLITILTLLTAWAAPALAEDTCAFIADVKGKVRYQKPGAAWENARIMSTLPAGTKLDVPKGGSITLSFTKGGARKQVNGPSTATLTATGVDGGGVVDRTPGARTAVLLPANVNIQQMGGVRHRGPKELRITSDETTADLHPTITWDDAGEKYDSFEIGLVDPDGKRIYKATFGGDRHQLTVPKTVALAYGQRYTIEITGNMNGMRVTPREDYYVDVLEQPVAEKIEAARAAAEEQFKQDPHDVTPLVILMAIYDENGLYTPALKVAEQIALLRPDDTNLYYIMGKLYLARRETDKADAMFNKAGRTD